ncbi:MAG: caspase family protein [Pseudomonadota bacterium]|nr:caspase family protein [Pseudomonadota bacterium]
MMRTLLIAIAVFAAGCATQSAMEGQPDVATANADSLMVVDCLLPGQIRKLGSGMTYLTPRRPAKTTAVDCEIRGGEYVAYDRASYATALKVWLPQAQEGNADAQNYVGEIYEKGLGIEADYMIAANWYRKAAEQGNTRAQINLGYLYESGLGVPRDLTVAMNWYRRASGLTDGELEYVSSIEVAQREAAVARTAGLEQEVGALRGELDAKDSELAKRQGEVQRTQSELNELQRQLNERRATVAAAGGAVAVSAGLDDAQRKELEGQLDSARSEQERLIEKLANEQLASGSLKRELDEANAELAGRKQELADIQRELDDARGLLTAEQGKGGSGALVLQARVTHLEGALQTRQGEVSALERDNRTREQALNRQIADAGKRIDTLQGELERSGGEVAALRAQLTESSSEKNELQAQLQDARQEQERLTGKLAGQQLEAARLQQDLTRAGQDLDRQRLELEIAGNELVSAQQALSSSSAGADDAQQLRTRIDELQAGMHAGESEIAQRETRMRAQQTEFEASLAESTETERSLQLALNERNQEVAVLGAQLAAANTALARAAGTDEKAAALEQQLKEREAELQRQKEEVARLQSDVAQTAGSEMERTEIAAVIAARPVGPLIEIIEPPLAVMRGIPSIQLRSDVPELELIGRVDPAAKLMSFRINDVAREVDPGGLFKVSVPVKDPQTPVNVVAVDKSGKRTAVDFVIIPRDAKTGQAVATTPKLKAGKPASPVDFGNYHALVIGNNNYRHMTNLSTASADARDVAKLLESRYGFQTRVLLDADRYAMLSALNDYREKLTENDNLLIYYAGHGELDSVNLRGHWLPVDAEPDSSANWISNIAITDILNVMAAKHVLVVADSCYSGSLTRSSIARLQTGLTDEAKVKWYRTMSKARTRAVLTSGGVKPVLDSGGGDHSVFARAFIDVLNENDGILEGFHLYREVQIRVKLAAATLRVEQNPQYAPIKYAGHEAGEFFFRPVALASIPGGRELLAAVR